MIEYRSFYFAFSSGSDIIIGLTCLFIDALTMNLFGLSKMGMFLMSVNWIIIIQAILGISIQSNSTPVKSVLMAIFFSLIMVHYSLYGLFRCWQMVGKKLRKIGVFGNLLMFILLLILVAEVLDPEIGVLVIICIIPFPMIIVLLFCYKIIAVIRSNPIHQSDMKQRQLLRIMKSSTISGIFITILSIGCVITGAVLQISDILFIGIMGLHYNKIVFSVNTFLILLNKSIEYAESDASGMSKFKSELEYKAVDSA